MLVILGYSHRDLAAAKQLVEWIGQLEDGVVIQQHRLLLLASALVPMPDVMLLNALGQKVFSQCESIRQTAMTEGEWPRPQNAMFRAATQWVKQKWAQHWLWLEPDCAPLKAGWLDTLHAEYIRAAKPFMGAAFDRPFRHINGVMVYPPFLARHNPLMAGANQVPWDLVGYDVTLRRGHVTPLIERKLADYQKNLPLTFPGPEALNQISPAAVLFHGCKDGTLIDQLRAVRCPVPTWKRLPKHRHKEGQPETVAVVELGRYGDIVNILPICKHLHDAGTTPYLVVAKEFKSILAGVSYVHPYPLPLHYSQLADAVQIAHRKFDRVIQAQIYGRGYKQMALSPHFNWESWRMAGYEKHFFDPAFRLVFDQRDAKREAKLVKKVFRTDKPKIVTNLTSSYSSPLPFGQQILQRIMAKFGEQYEVVDIGLLRASKPYDVLALIERASVFVSIDTMTTHIAGATRTPVVALMREGWSGGLPRFNCACAITYPQLQADPGGSRVVEAIAGVLQQGNSQPEPNVTETIWHVYTDYTPSDFVTQHRNAMAALSWRFHPWTEVPVADASLKRFCRESGRAWPYIKDVLDAGCAKAKPTDIVCYTNADICIATNTAERIQSMLRTADACYAHRRDFTYEFTALMPDSCIPHGSEYCGADLFAFRASWWQKYRKELPDMVLGLEAWDACFKVLVDRTEKGKDHILHDTIYHRRHNSFWERPENRYSLDSQKRMLALAAGFLSVNGINPATHGIEPKWSTYPV